MTSAQQQRIKELFDAAFELAPAAQTRLLAEACADDHAVRAEVEQLLRRHRDTPDFLEAQPIHELFGELLELPAEPDLAGLHPGRAIGPYRLARELGRGGMGAVYLAERADGVHSEPVAIKFVWPGGGRELVQRFRRERAILARLDHPNIARLLDGGTTEEGWHYLVMEYVAGQPLTAYCREQRLTLAARLTLFRTVCDAVQYAHQNLVIHRDLKPSNILVTAAQDGKAATPKLLDFGIAKLLDPHLVDGEPSPSTLTRGGLLPLTPLYASPEQARNEPITTASDVYSLGVLLYELLTGVKPYRTASLFPPDQLRAVLEEEPERPSLRVAERMKDEGGRMKENPLHPSSFILHPSVLRGDLDNIVLKALQKDVRLRYATAEQLSDDLQRHLQGEPVTARPATWRYRASKYIGRNKTFVTAAGALLLVLVTGALLAFWQLRASQARERQQRYELYAADMRQAGADWGAGNLIQMGALLEQHRPGNGVDDKWHGQEWFLLWKLLHTEKFTMRHQASTVSVVFTPDGKALLTGTQERIEKWDARNGQALGLFATYPFEAERLRFFKTGARLLVNNGRNRLSIWDYAAQRLLLELPAYPMASYGGLVTNLSPDETKLVISNDGGPFQIWDTSTGQLLESLSVPAERGANPPGPAIFAPDGKLLCLLPQKKHLALWDLKARRVVVQLDPQSADLRALQPFAPVGHLFSHDGTRYYLPTEDFLIRVWDYPHGGKPIQVLAGHEYHIETPALSHDGKLLASGSNDRTLRLWDTQTGKLLVTLKNESQTFGPVFSPDDKYLAAVSMRALLTKVWDVQSLLATTQTLAGIQTLGLSPDGKLLTYSPDIGLCWHDLQTGQRLPPRTKVPFTPWRSYDSIRLSADGNLMAFAKDFRPNQPGIAVIQQSATGKIIAELKGHRGQVGVVAFSADGQKLATSGQADDSIKLWDTVSGRELNVLQGQEGILALDFSPDSSKLVSSGLDTTTRVWDIASGKELFKLGDTRSSWVLKARFSPDGKLIATSDMNFAIKLWDAATGQLRQTLKGHANTVYCLAFSPDGKRLASGSDDKTVRLWDLQTGTELTALHGHTAEVWHVFFTPDGKTLISSGEDGTRIWRTATEAEVQAHR